MGDQVMLDDLEWKIPWEKNMDDLGVPPMDLETSNHQYIL